MGLRMTRLASFMEGNERVIRVFQDTLLRLLRSGRETLQVPNIIEAS